MAFLVSLPILAVFGYLFVPATEVWGHLAETVLSDYLSNSFWLMLGVGFGVLLIGVPVAWLNSMCDYPGRRFFEWALLLPLAMPAYIIAYTYTGMLDFSGPVQTLLRELTGWGYGDYFFPEIRSLPGAIVMLSLVLFPYVYLLARAAFLEQSICVLEVSRTLGANAWQSFIKVALPLARPAIITGLSLALMETLADFGTVQYFGVSTFTTGIFRTWFGLGNSAAAAQLAAMLMSFVFILIMIERWSRRKARYHHTSSKYSAIPKYQLKGKWAVLAVISCAVPLILGFIIPVAQLLYWAITVGEQSFDQDFMVLIGHSLLLASLAAFFALGLALLLGYGKRVDSHPSVSIAARIAAMGYAVPGTVIAIGVLIPFAWLDTQLNSWLKNFTGESWGLMFSGTLFTLLFAYNVRFLSVSLQTVESGLGKIKPTLDNAGRSLGLNAFGVLRQLHLPLMKGTLLTALLLVFVDVLKELPATLILRPFNFNTLAVKAYELAADERLADAGLPSLMIVLVGIIPVILLSKTIGRSRVGQQGSLDKESA
ncbi:MAG: Ferric iron ABC transporter, permease protein [uncultured Thiotrichaceae bacterium]|uniref:Ferric iron ABC transporter, permease protein n=1 Tax=uncultured Thiotrichaceae bacterium TaxID=298394 RepID=A0A6S6TS34_9GAMM|nr:MAG: Ferric iron ABC transporter, permease protein [uncultured Thiotrichaceae bacterium]